MDNFFYDKKSGGERKKKNFFRKGRRREKENKTDKSGEGGKKSHMLCLEFGMGTFCGRMVENSQKLSKKREKIFQQKTRKKSREKGVWKRLAGAYINTL